MVVVVVVVVAVEVVDGGEDDMDICYGLRYMLAWGYLALT